MQYSEGKTGRVFTVKLHEDDPVYESIKKLAVAEKLDRAVLWIVGGVKNGKVIVGPEESDERPLKPMSVAFHEAHEILATGTLFPNEKGEPALHIHSALGRNGTTITGCPRINLDCWLITEIIVMEILDDKPYRKLDENGFNLLTMD